MAGRVESIPLAIADRYLPRDRSSSTPSSEEHEDVLDVWLAAGDE